MTAEKPYWDVLIVGGGPIGLACGLEAQKTGLSHLILEKGCLVNSLYNYPANMTFFSTSEKLEIGQVPFVSNNPKPLRTEALEYYRRVALSKNISIRLFEEVKTIQKDEKGLYTVQSNKQEYKAKNIIIATGFYDIPNYMGIKGEELSKVTHYYKEAHFYATQNVLVVGANNSAVDAALETYRKGAKVTMVIREEMISKSVKYWVRPDIENRIKEGEIKAYFQSELKEIRLNEVDILTPNGMITLENNFVIAMTGYQPNFNFLVGMGIKLSEDENRKPDYNPETQETNMENIYLAGVICGGMDTRVWFIENSRIHAEKIMQAIKAKSNDK